ncbi:MAG: PKD domain-containing protein [Culturomica sp.]|jgi:hypothetical protein|nr:PKD domain-containing protein [Culturomica sp.]
MRSLFRFIILPVFLVIPFFVNAQRNNHQPVSPDNTTVTWANDSMWYLNKSFFPIIRPNFALNLTFPAMTPEQQEHPGGGMYDRAVLDWGDGSTPDTLKNVTTKQTFPHTYNEGLFTISIKLYVTGNNDDDSPDTVYNKRVFNKNLDVEFKIVEPFEDLCIDPSIDSMEFVVVITSEDNPPGTTLGVRLTSTAALPPDFYSLPDTLWNDRYDTCRVYIKTPGGTKDFNLALTMSNHNLDEDDIVNNDNKTFRLFERPNLLNIFKFNDSVPIGQAVEGFTLCAGSAPDTVIHFTPETFLLYQTPRPTIPIYGPIPLRRGITVDYYYTADTADTDSWERVNDYLNVNEYVDTMEMKLKKPGFYKIEIEAFNQCNEPDSIHSILHTDSVKGRPEKRYFHVFGNIADSLVCRTPPDICENNSDTIVFVDKNPRSQYDAWPRFSFTANDSVNGGMLEDWYRIVSDTVYASDGKKYEYDPEALSELPPMKTDSIVYKLVFTKPGNLLVTMWRSIETCDSVYKSFSFNVGGLPEISVADTLLTYLADSCNMTLNSGGTYLDHCGEFTYTFPNFKSAVDSNYMPIDSSRFRLTKGSFDTTFIREDLTSGYKFVFDSVGNTESTITMDFRNRCGWTTNTQTVTFYTRTQPDVVLARNAVPESDTLCYSFDYNYIFEGTLPENHTDSIKTSIPVNMNGNPQNLVTLYHYFNENVKFNYVYNKSYPLHFSAERFKIVNTDAPSCYQEITDTLSLAHPPVFKGIPDSVLYCGTDSLELKLLVDTAAFGYVDWTLASGWKSTTFDDTVPSIEVLATRDTLYAKVVRTGECYVQDTFLFVKREAPLLKFTTSDSSLDFCVVDTKEFRPMNYVDTTNDEAVPGLVLKGFYKDDLGSSLTLYETGKRNNGTPITYNYSFAHFYGVYEMSDTKINQKFWNCSIDDTLTLNVKKSKIEFNDRDTINMGVSTSYSFDTYRSKGLRYDTLNIDQKKGYSWKVINGASALTQADSSLFGGVTYNADKDTDKDSLIFEVTGLSPCGDTVKAQFVLYLLIPRVYGFTDTICSNTADYALWGDGRARGWFIADTTLRWEILDAASKDWGTITPDSTAKAKFTAGKDLVGGDTVRIRVKGRYNSGDSEVFDTIYLKVNSAPEIDLSSVSLPLLTAGGTVDIRQIQDLQLNNVRHAVFYNLSNMTYPVASDSLNVRLNGISLGKPINVEGTARILAYGNYGCLPDTSQPVSVVYPVNARPFFRDPSYLKFCGSDSVRLSEVDSISGEDDYTVLKWELLCDTCPGHFDSDTTFFIVSGTEYGNQKIKLTTSKEFTQYDGTPASRSSYNATLEVDVVPLPTITFPSGSTKTDTICKDDGYYVRSNWSSLFTLSPASYIDSLLINGTPLTAAVDSIPFNKDEGEIDTMLISINLAGCWNEAILDTIFVYRLPSMITTMFEVETICENSVGTVDGLELNPMAVSYKWVATGLILSDTTTLTPSYTSAGNYGNIQLEVQPPLSCRVEKSTREYFTIIQLPDLELADTVSVCDYIDTVNIDVNIANWDIEPAGIDSIEWKKFDVGTGTKTKIGTTSGMDTFPFVRTAQDSAAGYVKLIADVFPAGICGGQPISMDTVTVIFEHLPQIVWERNYQLTHTDTICLDDSCYVRKDWSDIFTVSPSVYSDSLFIGDYRMSDTDSIPFYKGAGETDTLLLFLNVQRCWSDNPVIDTLLVYRLPSMIATPFVADSICENGQGTVRNLELNPMTVSHDWTSTGLTLTNEETLTPSYTFTGTTPATITLEVQPPFSCPVETITAQNVKIIRLPEIDFADTTVCSTVRSIDFAVTVLNQDAASIDSIEWMKLDLVTGVGTKIATTSGTNSFTFVRTEQDSVDGGARLAPKIYSSIPCVATGVITTDTFNVVLTPMPEITWFPGEEVCWGDTLKELDIAGAGIIQYEVLPIGAGTLDTLNGFVPSETYDGEVNLSVLAAGLGKCAAETTRSDYFIHVYSAPKPDLTASSVHCEQQAINFETRITGAARYDWDFGDGTAFTDVNPKQAYTYSDTGEYTVTLMSNYDNGCSRGDTLEIYAHAKPEASFTYPMYKNTPQVAVNTPATFTNTTQSVDSVKVFNWFVDDLNMQRPNVSPYIYQSFNTVEDHKVDLIVETEYGCLDTAHSVLEVVAVPQPQFTVAFDSCVGEITSLINNSPSLYGHHDVRWDIGGPLTNPATDSVYLIWQPNVTNQNPVYYTRDYQDNPFKVVLTLSNAAGSYDYSVDLNLVSLLEIGLETISQSNECGQLRKFLKNTSLGDADSIFIDWGDGTSNVFMEKIEMIPHKYTNELETTVQYDIEMTIKNLCDVQTAKTVMTVLPSDIEPNPQLSDSSIYRNRCFDMPIGFLDKTTGISNVGYRATWYFESGVSQSVLQKDTVVEHTFSNPGTYMVRFEVEDKCNTLVDSVQVVVNGNNTVDMKMQDGIYCSNTPVTLEATFAEGTTISNYVWVLDGKVMDNNEKEFTNTYAAGRHTIVLSTNTGGCSSDRIVKEIDVELSPDASILPLPKTIGCTPFTLVVDGYDWNKTGGIFEWDFGNGATSINQIDTVTYEEDGTYNIRLKINHNGCVSTDSMEVVSLFNPEPSFTVDGDLYCTVDGNITLNFTNTTVDRENVYFEWFNNGNRFSMLENPESVSLQNYYGEIEILLLATANNGCYRDAVHKLVSSTMVTVAFENEPSEICEDAEVHFNAVTNNATSFNWNINGEDVQNPAFDYTFADAGEYIVKLRAENADGCVDSIQSTVPVYPLPEAAFTWEKDFTVAEGYPEGSVLPQIENGGVRFTNNSFVSPVTWGDVLYNNWNFGDETTSIEKNPAHQFKNNGDYWVELAVLSEYGCVDTTQQLITIDKIKSLYIPTAMAPLMSDPGMALFQPKGIGLDSYKIEVYDKWGGTCLWSSVLLENGSPTEAWDGTFGGTVVPAGTYVWKVTAVFFDGDVWNQNGKTSGYFTVIR